VVTGDDNSVTDCVPAKNGTSLGADGATSMADDSATRGMMAPDNPTSHIIRMSIPGTHDSERLMSGVEQFTMREMGTNQAPLDHQELKATPSPHAIWQCAIIWLVWWWEGRRCKAEPQPNNRTLSCWPRSRSNGKWSLFNYDGNFRDKSVLPEEFMMCAFYNVRHYFNRQEQHLVTNGSFWETVLTSAVTFYLS